jgi:diaminopimelate decarboxylase
VVFDTVHVHIGSGGDPAKWRENVDREIGFVEKYFPRASRINFGGGLRTARMPDETPADVMALGAYAKSKIQEFYDRTGRKLVMEVEPGTYLMANAAYIVTTVIDIKNTGPDGFQFLVCDGGMEVNARPLLYGSRHPFYVVSADGEFTFSEFDLKGLDPVRDLRVVVGRCCESGDSQSLDAEGHIVARLISKPEVGDFLVIGGCGAYCASMSPFSYNSHTQAPEVLLRGSGRLEVIRRSQDVGQLSANELSLKR